MLVALGSWQVLQGPKCLFLVSWIRQLLGFSTAQLCWLWRSEPWVKSICIISIIGKSSQSSHGESILSHFIDIRWPIEWDDHWSLYKENFWFSNREDWARTLCASWRLHFRFNIQPEDFGLCPALHQDPILHWQGMEPCLGGSLKLSLKLHTHGSCSHSYLSRDAMQVLACSAMDRSRSTVRLYSSCYCAPRPLQFLHQSNRWIKSRVSPGTTRNVEF